MGCFFIYMNHDLMGDPFEQTRAALLNSIQKRRWPAARYYKPACLLAVLDGVDSGDSRTGLAHSAVVTAANVHDKRPLPDLLHGNEQRVYGDSAYASQKALIESKAPKARDFTNQRVRRAGEVDEVERSKNHNKSKVRARVEHVFAVVKRLWGFAKVRYQGLAKNATRSFVVLGLANIYLARQRLMA